jgi:hypothetical protein
MRSASRLAKDRATGDQADDSVRVSLALGDDQVQHLADAIAARVAELAGPARRRWLDSQRAADYLGISTEAIRDLAATRKITFSQTCRGAPMYFDPADLDAYRRKHRREAVN